MLRFLPSQYLRLKATMLCYYAKPVENPKEKNVLSVASERKPSCAGRREPRTGGSGCARRSTPDGCRERRATELHRAERGAQRRVRTLPDFLCASPCRVSMSYKARQDISALGSGPMSGPRLLTHACPTGPSGTFPQRLLNTGRAQHEWVHLLQRMLPISPGDTPSVVCGSRTQPRTDLDTA